MLEIEEKIVNKYFVDEAGDLNLFDKNGKIIVGNEGVSKYFMVGIAYIKDYNALKNSLN